MSKFVVGSIIAGIVGGALYGAATRRATTRAEDVVPVDDEINAEPFIRDRKRAHELHLDEDSLLRQRRTTMNVKREGDMVLTQPRDASIDEKKRYLYANDESIRLEAIDPKRAKQAEYEFILANEKRLEAEEIAAKASGAVAAATSLRDKEAMDAERREALQQRLKDLEAAEKQIKNELRDVTSLVRKDSKVIKDAEHQAEKLLNRQEKLMLDAARHEHLAEQMEQERWQFLQRRKEEAERRARLLETQRETEAERAAREAEAALETRRRLEAEMALAKNQEAMRAALATQRAEAERKRREAEEALRQSRALLLDAENERKGVDSRLSSVGRPEDIDRKLRDLNREIELHSRASDEANNALRRLEEERGRALAEARDNESLASRFKSWWGGDSTSERPSIVATSEATGEARASDVVVEKKRLFHSGTKNKTEVVPSPE